MNNKSSATATITPPLSKPFAGISWGLLGVAAFSFTVPFTRFLVADGAMSPMLVGAGRAVIAAILAAIALTATRQRVPSARQWLRLAIIAAGVVAGFPLLTSYALIEAPASHGAVVIAFLPAATAIFAVIRGRERPPRSFWITAALGAIAAVSFASIQNSDLGGLHWADLLLFAAVIVCAIGYAEGGLLSRELGSWQTISWALVLASPIMLGLSSVEFIRNPPHAALLEWGAFGYLAAISMFLGFFAWYRGLAIGPMAQVSQVQLTQPVMSIAWAGLILGESIGALTIAGGIAVILCALLAIRARNRPQHG